jgi:integrase
LRPSKANAIDSKLKKCEYFSIEDVRKILSLDPKTLMDERSQAAIAFLYLSGMRIKAFLTLPISCVDLGNFKIYQMPSRGVATKFHKAAVTSLLRIPDMLDIVKAWDKKIKEVFPPNQTWYAPLHQQKYHYGYFDITDEKASPNREKGFRMELKSLCDRAGIPYLSPHKLRHGHAIYGIKHARNIKELKAVSQNLMHDSISVTDGIYGNLNEDDISSTLAGFTDDLDPSKNDNSKTQDLVKAMVMLQQNPELLKRLIEA